MPIVDELGTNAYADVLKQLSFEVAEIYMEMCELKLERIGLKKAKNSNYIPKESEIVKSNEYAKESIKYFEKFTNFFRRAAPVPLFPMPGAKKDEVGSSSFSFFFRKFWFFRFFFLTLT
jgi:hypothetical protein